MAIVRPIPYQIDLNTRIRTNPRIVATVGDKDSLTLQVSLTVNGNEFDLTGWKVYFKALLPNQENFVLDDSVSIKNAKTGSFEYTFNTAAFSVPGQVKDAMFMLAKGDKPDQIVHSFYLTYEVKNDPTIGYLQAESFVSDYERFKDELKDMMQDSFDAANQAIEDSQHAIDNAAQAVSDFNTGLTAANTRLTTLNNQITSVGNANWQKVKVTQDSGNIEFLTGFDFNDPGAKLTTFKPYCISAGINPPTPYGSTTPVSGYGFLDYQPASASIQEAVYRPYNSTKEFKAVKWNGVWGAFIDTEADLRSSAQLVKLTLDTGANKRQSSIDLNTLFEPGRHYVSGNDTLNKPNGFGDGYLDVSVGTIDGSSPSGYYKHIYYEYGTDRVAVRDRKQNAATKTTWTDWSIKGSVLLWSGTATKNSPAQALNDSLTNYPYVGIVASASEGNSPRLVIFKNIGASGYVIQGSNVPDSGTSASYTTHEARVYFDSSTFKSFTIDFDNRIITTSSSVSVDSGTYTTVYEVRGLSSLG